jgi:hypothetical protein
MPQVLFLGLHLFYGFESVTSKTEDAPHTCKYPMTRVKIAPIKGLFAKTYR